jgi:prepilin-type N-terminal cleavage/methylation domain-containing protein
MGREPGGSKANESGFTLIELLITLVMLGVLTAIALVGINGLKDKGSTSACQSTKDAAKAATSAFYANTGGSYPQTFTDLTSPPSGKKLLVPGTGLAVGTTTITGRGWTINLIAGATPADPIHFEGC